MTKRERLEAKIESKKSQIEKLESEIIELTKETLLLSDEKQWFVEKEETRVISKRPKKEETLLVGRIYWKEDFGDEDTGDVVTVERSEVVRENGEWV